MFAKCWNSFVGKNHSLLTAKFARYSLQKLLVAKKHPVLVAKSARYSLQQIIVLLVAEIARCKISFVIHSTKLGESFRFLNIICFLKPKISKLFLVNVLRWNLLLTEHYLTHQYTNECVSQRCFKEMSKISSNIPTIFRLVPGDKY